MLNTEKWASKKFTKKKSTKHKLQPVLGLLNLCGALPSASMTFGSDLPLLQKSRVLISCRNCLFKPKASLCAEALILQVGLNSDYASLRAPELKSSLFSKHRILFVEADIPLNMRASCRWTLSNSPLSPTDWNQIDLSTAAAL